ncbi:flagellar hook-length control protein FliK [Oceanispirochaeta sp.]|jgi:flagellar protein FlbC|uniref:flagellar hook-length control protein FliK n=1 Tax=Oceanispirochaeta sp. TaxID=2035350 RepID=UPI00263561F4|nr:flagellar hook-length control protein FliK [Oceanispirochaeta sp.]MDA3956550.1 flagellar hook-length control protein FliK [Oceanispirochaeta sp.]
MIQLSSPSPDSIPVQQGKSPDRAPGLKKNSDGFKKALVKEKKSLESEAESPRKTVAASKNKTADAASQSGDKRTVSSPQGDKDRISDKKLLAKLFAQSGKGQPVTGRVAEEKILSLLKTHKKTKLPEIASLQGSKDSSEVLASLSLPQKSVTGKVNTKIEDPKSDGEAAPKIIETAPQVLKDGVKPGEPDLQKSSAPSVLLAHSDLKPDGESKKESSLSKNKKKSSPADVKISFEDRRRAVTADKTVPLLKEVDSHGPANRMTLELVPSEELPGMMPQGDQVDSSGKTFVLQTAEEQKGAALLDRQLHEKGTQELTKNIRFVLKDNKEGEIKLILKPESLGKVRINLNVHENNIVGKIIVENNSVRQAFLNNLADLTKALEESGFGSASLDVSVGGGQTQGRQQHSNEKPVYYSESALGNLDGQIPVVYEDGMTFSQINMVV